MANARISGGIGELNARKVRESFEVALRNCCALLDPTVQVRQLHVENSGLHGIQAAVVAQGGVKVTAGHAVHCQLTHALS